MSMSSPMSIILAIWTVVVGIYIVLLFIGSLVGLREEDTLYLSAGEAKMEAEQRQVQKRIGKLAPYKRGFAYGAIAMTVVLAATWIASVVRELMH
jgi:hypothetical protein